MPLTSSGVIVIGAGGHAKVCIEMLREGAEEVSYCVSAESTLSSILGVPILRGDENLLELRRQGFSKCFVAIGSNALRIKLARICSDLGFVQVNAVSQSSIVSNSAQLGNGIAVMPGAVVGTESFLGNNVIINTSASVDHDTIILEGAHIGPRVVLAGNVTVGKQSFLGAGSIVIPDLRIGENVTVGAGSLVLHDVPSGVTVVGNPAKRVLRKAP